MRRSHYLKMARVLQTIASVAKSSTRHSRGLSPRMRTKRCFRLRQGIALGSSMSASTRPRYGFQTERVDWSLKLENDRYFFRCTALAAVKRVRWASAFEQSEWPNGSLAVDCAVCDPRNPRDLHEPVTGHERSLPLVRDQSRERPFLDRTRSYDRLRRPGRQRRSRLGSTYEVIAMRWIDAVRCLTEHPGASHLPDARRLTCSLAA